MEICKQLFDLGRLFDQIGNIETVINSFEAFASKEISYRETENSDRVLTPALVLQDTIDTCEIIARRGGGDNEQKVNFKELQKGIKSFGSGFLMEGHFRLDDAVAASARVAYLAAKIRDRDMEPVEFYEGQDIKDLTIEDSNWNFLNKLKKLPEKSAFYYWYQAINILGKT